MIQIKQVSGIFTLAILFLFSNYASAQTYANPELQKEEEIQLAKKIEWIKANPALYRAQGGNPDDVMNYEASKAEKVIVKTIYPSPVALDNPSLFHLISVSAVDINHKHTAEEMIAFEKEAQSEWNKMNMVIDWEAHLLYYIPRNTEKQPSERSFQIIENRLQLLGCKECESNSYVLVVNSKDQIVLQLKSQNENEFFVYQFEFNK